MKISEMLTHPNVTLSVTPADLKEFALELLEESRLAAAEAEASRQTNKRYSVKEAAKYLGRTEPTIWRWRKVGLLEPDGYLASKPYYLKSSLDKIIGL